MALPAYEYVIQFPLGWDRAKPAEGAVDAPILGQELARLRASLEAAIASRVTSGAELVRNRKRQTSKEEIATLITPFDRLLDGGLPKGKLVELVGRYSTGRFGVVLSTLASATSAGEAAVLIDLGDHLDPDGAQDAGVDLSRLLWIRPQSVKEAVLAAEMSITTGFPLVIIDLGIRFRGRRVHDTAWIRLARTATKHTSALLVSTPFPIAGTSSEAAVTMTRSRAVWQGSGKTPRILTGLRSLMELGKHRHKKPGVHEEAGVMAREAIRQTPVYRKSKWLGGRNEK